MASRNVETRGCQVKSPREPGKTTGKKREEYIRSSSACTKSSSTKASPTPDMETIQGPLINSIVNEDSHDSEVSAIEDPAPLLINYLNSKDILTGIKANQNAINLSGKFNPNKYLKSNNSNPSLHTKIRLLKKRSLTEVHQKIKNLKGQISELSSRASLSESELRLKEMENRELKSLVSSLREIVDQKDNGGDKTTQSMCKSCTLF